MSGVELNVWSGELSELNVNSSSDALCKAGFSITLMDSSEFAEAFVIVFASIFSSSGSAFFTESIFDCFSKGVIVVSLENIDFIEFIILYNRCSYFYIF